MPLTNQFSDYTAKLDELLRPGTSFDLVKRPLQFAEKDAVLYFIDGFIKDEIMEKIMEFFMKLKPEDIAALVPDTKLFADSLIPDVETDANADMEQVVSMVLSGAAALLVDGFPEAVVIDARTYPVRSVEEPDADRVLRGSRDGFVETLVFNTALLRRRIRDPMLTVELFQVGTKSKTDLAVCYLEGKADPKFVKTVQERLKALTVPALTMGQESLAEAMFPQRWYNPFPKVRYTERPDSGAASVLEGKVLIFVDNSPSAMILPTSIFDFVQETDDFYFPPLTGTYMRLTRILIFFLTLLFLPVWYLLVENPQWIPPWLDFIKIAEPISVPLIFQLLLAEFAIDGLKLASLNTPSPLSGSFSIIGGLILGDFAVKAGWFAPEVILYMAFVAIANFTQPSLELGYAFKFIRMLLLVLSALFGVWGFGGGLLLTVILVCTNKTVAGKSYLFPLIPFHGKELRKLFFRTRLKQKKHTSK